MNAPASRFANGKLRQGDKLRAGFENARKRARQPRRASPLARGVLDRGKVLCPLTSLVRKISFRRIDLLSRSTTPDRPAACRKKSSQLCLRRGTHHFLFRNRRRKTNRARRVLQPGTTTALLALILVGIRIPGRSRANDRDALLLA